MELSYICQTLFILTEWVRLCFFSQTVNLAVVLSGEREKPSLVKNIDNYEDQANVTGVVDHTADNMGLFSVTDV
jgi:hypothetical protein